MGVFERRYAAYEDAARSLGLIIRSATAISGVLDGYEVEAFDGYREGESGSWVIVRCPSIATELVSYARVRKVGKPQRRRWQRRGRLLPRPDGLFVHARGNPDDVDVWLGTVGAGLMVAPEGTVFRPDGSLRIQLLGESFTAHLIASRIQTLVSVCEAMGA